MLIYDPANKTKIISATKKAKKKKEKGRKPKINTS
jgi:hypothetical protein